MAARKMMANGKKTAHKLRIMTTKEINVGKRRVDT
jgi:hypothetical protein